LGNTLQDEQHKHKFSGVKPTCNGTARDVNFLSLNLVEWNLPVTELQETLIFYRFRQFPLIHASEILILGIVNVFR